MMISQHFLHISAKRGRYFTSFPEYEKLSSEEIDMILLNDVPKTNKAILYLLVRKSFLEHTTLKQKDSQARRVGVCCKDANCSFYLLALPSGPDGLTVKKYMKDHSCHVGLFEIEQRSSIPSAFYADQIRPIVNAGKICLELLCVI